MLHRLGMRAQGGDLGKRTLVGQFHCCQGAVTRDRGGGSPAEGRRLRTTAGSGLSTTEAVGARE